MIHLIFYISFHMTYPHFTLPIKTRSYKKNASHCFASSVSTQSISVSVCIIPASRVFVQHSPSPASIAQHSVLCPAYSSESSIVFSVGSFCSLVLSLFQVLPPFHTHHQVSISSRYTWELETLLAHTPFLHSPLLHSQTTEGVPLHSGGF